MTFIEHNNIIYYIRVLRIIVSLSNKLLLDIGVSLALSRSYSHLILALATISSSWGVKTVIISLLEVFKDRKSVV